MAEQKNRTRGFGADLFAKANLEIEDMLLLEAFQISYLPGWIPERDLSTVLRAHPNLEGFLRRKCPEIEGYLDRIMNQHTAVANPEELSRLERNLLVTIADLLVYNRCPEVYDSLEFHGWDFNQVTSVTRLNQKIVLDVGSGTGRVAIEAAGFAHNVYAVEPVTRLREFIREKAVRQGISNLFVVDGFLHAIPFADDFADVLITSHAMGWRLEEELEECERVVRNGGYIIHCPGDHGEVLTSSEWGYSRSEYQEADGIKTKYWKRVE